MIDPEFMQILKSIGMLAMEIGYEGFYSLFNEAYMILNEEKPIEVSDLLIKTGLNDSAYRLILAASTADVFGGMGSWNDSPSGAAYHFGKGEEYESLSHKLYIMIQRAIMYAVNM